MSLQETETVNKLNRNNVVQILGLEINSLLFFD